MRRAAEALWVSRGIAGVPAVVVEGKGPISGGQPAGVPQLPRNLVALATDASLGQCTRTGPTSGAGRILIVSQIQTSNNPISARAAWAGLRRFENQSLVQNLIVQKFSLPKKQHSNALKQAKQIRYSLIQAKEYHDASKSVTLATRPLLLYYSAMSLALSEILFKQSGDSCIDKMRGLHSHHGLERAWTDRFDSSSPIDLSAGCLRARRAAKADGNGYGTFELWHRSAREHPLGGKRTTTTENGTQSGFVAIFSGLDVRFPNIPDCGITLLDCYRSLPSMAGFLVARGIKPSLSRATITQDYNIVDHSFQTKLTFHPDPLEILEKTYQKVLIEPIGVYRVEILEHRSGITLKWQWKEGDIQYGVVLPTSIQQEDKIIYFFSEIESLNEFGLMYVGLYILGMYARYYPERWMNDVESSSELALSAFEFLDVCEERLPACALAEFSGVSSVRTAAYV